jgi:hypothetical protein
LDGDDDGFAVGENDGLFDGFLDGEYVGEDEGPFEGEDLGVTVGVFDGDDDGFAVGENDGLFDGDKEVGQISAVLFPIPTAPCPHTLVPTLRKRFWFGLRCQ